MTNDRRENKINSFLTHIHEYKEAWIILLAGVGIIAWAVRAHDSISKIPELERQCNRHEIVLIEYKKSIDRLNKFLDIVTEKNFSEHEKNFRR